MKQFFLLFITIVVLSNSLYAMEEHASDTAKQREFIAYTWGLDLKNIPGIPLTVEIAPSPNKAINKLADCILTHATIDKEGKMHIENALVEVIIRAKEFLPFFTCASKAFDQCNTQQEKQLSPDKPSQEASCTLCKVHRELHNNPDYTVYKYLAESLSQENLSINAYGEESARFTQLLSNVLTRTKIDWKEKKLVYNNTEKLIADIKQVIAKKPALFAGAVEATPLGQPKNVIEHPQPSPKPVITSKKRFLATAPWLLTTIKFSLGIGLGVVMSQAWHYFYSK